MAKVGKRAARVERPRSERKFEPQSTMSPTVVMALGGLGALLMGAGVYGQFVRPMLGTGAAAPLTFAPWLLGGGSVIEGIAVWLGTSGAPALRVGDGGIGEERDGLRRIPWHALERLSFDAGASALSARGKDESGAEITVIISVAAFPQGAAWAVREARARVPNVVDVPESAVPEARQDAGLVLPLDSVQVVGKRCAATGKLIAFEPDARVCPRCERVYHKDAVPSSCVCGFAFEEQPEGAPAPAA